MPMGTASSLASSTASRPQPDRGPRCSPRQLHQDRAAAAGSRSRAEGCRQAEPAARGHVGVCHRRYHRRRHRCRQRCRSRFADHDPSAVIFAPGGAGGRPGEVLWVQTSYLIAEVIAIPLSGFLSRALGTRLLFAISASGFTLASLLCGFTSSIEQMILWRAIQGFLGAGMIPTVFASAYTVFPRSKFHIVGPIIGLVATLAPTVGPTVGGFITDAMSWHWLL